MFRRRGPGSPRPDAHITRHACDRHARARPAHPSHVGKVPVSQNDGSPDQAASRPSGDDAEAGRRRGGTRRISRRFRDVCMPQRVAGDPATTLNCDHCETSGARSDPVRSDAREDDRVVGRPWRSGRRFRPGESRRCRFGASRRRPRQWPCFPRRPALCAGRMQNIGRPGWTRPASFATDARRQGVRAHSSVGRAADS
jgi:hypothetical protein